MESLLFNQSKWIFFSELPPLITPMSFVNHLSQFARINLTIFLDKLEAKSTYFFLNQKYKFNLD